MSPQWMSAIVPVAGTMLGLLAGLLSPVITDGVGRRNTRRTDERARCDDILGMFRDVNVVTTLRNPRDGTRRALLLTAVRIRDHQARSACTNLVEYSSRGDATDDEILDRWTTMIDEVARVHRAAS